MIRFAPVLAVSALLAGPALAEDILLVQSSTSTQNSGLYDHILPLAEAALDLDIRVVAVGTGQALNNAERCDGDMLIVHARDAEEAFVEAGFGTGRHDLMYNDFIIIGPSDNPAGLRRADDIAGALGRIATAGAPFASRGDDSGTHRKETSLWEGVADVAAASGSWYREAGAGMGATLNLAIGMGAYTMSDRATWLAFENKADHEILFEGDPDLFNQYGVIPVSPDHCETVNADGAAAFTNWLISAPGQAAIAGFMVDGQQLFFPNAE
ncbi:sulfate transporter [Rhodophyticola sp. CCM32]|uniref:substrate-binding domain-containing protein n=1 Tax=Rhodophyticola sp. CCM32 TaxID=2916397 RepID=UPI00107FB2A0|nr:substrate-binding domain-containing protein [Rhodophyticola sp. CCM32]QBY00770.1 sulfate transporter [Rhodophyticola sp. CCM32]